MGFSIHFQARNRSCSPSRVHVPLVNPAIDAGQVVRGSVFVYVDDHATSSGPSSPISSTPPIFLNPIILYVFMS